MATAAETRRFRVPAPATLSVLWLVALLAYGAGDTATTLAVIHSPTHLELNPLVAAAVARFGAAGVVGLKLLAVVCCGWLCLQYGLRDDDGLFTYGPPALLCVLGLVTTVGNLAVLA
ncbi:MAG: hypothetical protein V5A37_08155 [Halobacteriales archaeon]|jgi:hypothetical protein